MIDLDILKLRIGDGLEALYDILTEVERLRRIEVAARAHLKEWEGGDTMAHDTRKALKQALEEE